MNRKQNPYVSWWVRQSRKFARRKKKRSSNTWIGAWRARRSFTMFFKQVQVYSRRRDAVFIRCAEPLVKPRDLVSIGGEHSPTGIDEWGIVLWISDLLNGYFQQYGLLLGATPARTWNKNGPDLYEFQLTRVVLSRCWQR